MAIQNDTLFKIKMKYFPLANPIHGHLMTYKLLFLISISALASPALGTTDLSKDESSKLFQFRDYINAPEPFSQDFSGNHLLESLGDKKANEIKIHALVEHGLELLSTNKKKEAFTVFNQAWDLDRKSPIPGVLIAYRQLQDKEYKNALDTADKIQLNSPEFAKGYTLSGLAYLYLKDEKLAIEFFSKAIKVKNGDDDASLNLAQIYQQKGNLAKAKEILYQATNDYPNNFKILRSLADLEYKTLNPGKAITILEKTIAEHPNDVAPRITLAQLYLSEKKYPSAFDVMNEALKHLPNDPELVEFIGVTYFQLGYPDKSLPFLQQAVKIVPENANLHYNLALAYEQLKNYPQGMVEIDNALKLDPNLISAKFIKAKLLALSAKIEDAKSLLKELDTLAPESAETADLKGRIALSEQHTDEAIKNYELAVKRKPDSPMMISHLAIAQLQTQKTDLGFETLRTWLKKHPDNNSVKAIMVDLLLTKNRFEEAITYCNEILKNQPDRADISNNLAWLLAETGHLDKALNQAEKTMSLAPDNPLYLDTLGTILLKMNDSSKAIEILRKADKLSENNPVISYHLALALSNSSQAEAKEILKRLLASNKSFKERELSQELFDKLP